MCGYITKNEYEFALTAIEKILSEPVEHIELTNEIPPLADVADSNTVFKGKLSILFVDMRDSSELSDELKSKKMVKIYRSFIRLIIQAIRYSGGYSRQFAGDGIMGAFQDSYDNEVIVPSSQKAIKAGRYIVTLLDYCLNPLLNKYMKEITVACGIGICTGEIMITKAGMRGKEANENCENELGIVWTGTTTNNASRYCSLAKGGEIFTDKITYDEAQDDKDNWAQCSRVKETQIFNGYLASDYYLKLDENVTISPIKAVLGDSSTAFAQGISEQVSNEVLTIINGIVRKSAELAQKLSELDEREAQIRVKGSINTKNQLRLSQWETKLNEKQTSLDIKANKVWENAYYLYFNIFLTAYREDKLVIQLGKPFWTELISKMFSLGKEIGKTEITVTNELDYHLIEVYHRLEMYDEAYDALCIQAEYGDCLCHLDVKDTVEKSGRGVELKSIIKGRINQGSNKTRSYYLEALEILKNMGY